MTRRRRALPDRILRTFTAYQRTAALKTAVELALFTEVGPRGARVEDLALRCGASLRGMRALCDSLVVDGFLAKRGGRYRLPEISARYLDRRSPEYLGDAAAFLTGGSLRGAFDRLTQAVRRGGTAEGREGTLSRENPAWVSFARGMGPLVRPLARGLADVLLRRREPVRRVLDVAAGHGWYGIEIARRRRGAEVVALDWAPVLGVARENARAAGLGRRFRFAAGSAFDVEWGDGFDLVLLVNFLHHFDAPGVVALLRRARASARAGGRVVAVEAPPDPGRVSPGPSAAFALVMLATTPGGNAYTLAEYRAMFREAGLGTPASSPIPGALHRAIVARR